MSNVDLGFLVIAAMIAAVCFGAGRFAQLFRRDKIFEGLAPGTVPLAGKPAREVRVRPGQEYSGEVAVAFSPPRGMRPGLVGTIVDGSADMRDISASIVDLAVRGHLRIEATEPRTKRVKDPEGKARDWRITLLERPGAGDPLNKFEMSLLASLASMTDEVPGSVLMSEWTRARAMDIRGLQQNLYTQTVRNGWYAKSPTAASSGCLGQLTVMAAIGIGILAVLGQPSFFTIVAGLVMAGSGIWLKGKLKPREPRTALGTAAMVQALGFKKYLATAEAEQFDFEEAAGIFSRYLPYAIVFGVADHWAKVFGEVAARSEAMGGPDLLESLIWFDLMGGDNLMFSAMWALGDGDMLAGVGELAGGVMELSSGFGDVAEGVGEFAGGVAEFIGDILDF